MALVPQAGGFESLASTLLGQVSPAVLSALDKKKNGKEDPDHILNYITANRFYVELEAEVSASFAECTSLSIKSAPTIFSEGGLNSQQRVLLTPATFENITLKRGLSNHPEFLRWLFVSLIEPTFPLEPIRRNINILVFNQAGETVWCWTLIGAIPISWKGPTLSAKSTEVGMEELTIAFEGFNFTLGEGSRRGGATTGRDMERDDQEFSFVSE
ncbi:MAG: phage tail protein [Cyanophyceae cyanobacterium]|jgi:phage tail-like protein